VWETINAHTGILLKPLRESDNLEYLCVDVKIILKWIFKTRFEEVWIGLIWFRIGIVVGIV
jgi:hypothetical protein